MNRSVLQSNVHLCSRRRSTTARINFSSWLVFDLFLNRLGDLRGSLAAAERGSAIARATADVGGLIWAEWMLGISHYLEGNQASAQRHCERGLTLAAERGGFKGNYFGCDHRIRALVALARGLWLRGFSERALTTAQQVIDEASSQEQPISICISLMYCSSVFLWTGDLTSAADFIEKLIAYSARYSLEPYRAAGIALQGELAIARGDAAIGVQVAKSAPSKPCAPSSTRSWSRPLLVHWLRGFGSQVSSRRRSPRSTVPLCRRRAPEKI